MFKTIVANSPSPTRTLIEGLVTKSSEVSETKGGSVTSHSPMNDDPVTEGTSAQNCTSINNQQTEGKVNFL